MSILKDMSTPTLKNYMKNLFLKTEGKTLAAKHANYIAHIIINPEDWIYLKTLIDCVDPTINKNFFEKGLCGTIWGADIWLSKNATKIKCYRDDQFDLIEEDYPEIAPSIKEFELEPGN